MTPEAILDGSRQHFWGRSDAEAILDGSRQHFRGRSDAGSYSGRPKKGLAKHEKLKAARGIGKYQPWREAESNSSPMSPIMSRRAEREASDEIIEARSIGVYSVFFMAIRI